MMRKSEILMVFDKIRRAKELYIDSDFSELLELKRACSNLYGFCFNMAQSRFVKTNKFPLGWKVIPQIIGSSVDVVELKRLFNCMYDISDNWREQIEKMRIP